MTDATRCAKASRSNGRVLGYHNDDDNNNNNNNVMKSYGYARGVGPVREIYEITHHSAVGKRGLACVRWSPVGRTFSENTLGV